MYVAVDSPNLGFPYLHTHSRPVSVLFYFVPEENVNLTDKLDPLAHSSSVKLTIQLSEDLLL